MLVINTANCAPVAIQPPDDMKNTRQVIRDKATDNNESRSSRAAVCGRSNATSDVTNHTNCIAQAGSDFLTTVGVSNSIPNTPSKNREP